jgi:hypothetical protein
MSMVDFADHMEEQHGLDHSTAYNRDRYQLNDLHIKAHYESLGTQASELKAQLEEALGIIDDLADLHDSYIGYLVAHNNYREGAAKEISDRINVLLLKQ